MILKDFRNLLFFSLNLLLEFHSIHIWDQKLFDKVFYNEANIVIIFCYVILKGLVFDVCFF